MTALGLYFVAGAVFALVLQRAHAASRRHPPVWMWLVAIALWPLVLSYTAIETWRTFRRLQREGRL